MCSNDLFERANQRAVGLIGRVRKRNSPFGRAQRGRTPAITGGKTAAKRRVWHPVHGMVMCGL